MADNWVSRLATFITIPSTAENPAALQEAVRFIATILEQHPDITVEHFNSHSKPSLLAYFGKRRPERFGILLNGHVDVVAGKPEQFKPRIKGGLLYGRGALDMKAAALVLTEIFCVMAPKVSYPLGLQIVSDEETGGSDGTAYQIAQGVLADFVLAGEFTPPGTLCNESKGVCRAEVTCTGKVAHSAYPWSGRNAIVEAHHFIGRLLQAIPVPARPTWCTTANVATITTPNTAYNLVPDATTVGVDIRYIPEDARFTTKKSALRYLQTLAPGSKVRVFQHEPCHYTNPNGADIQRLASAIKQTTGKPASYIQKPGAADVRYYSSLGIPTVVFGVQGSGPHADDEYVELKSLERYAETLRVFLEMPRV